MVATDQDIAMVLTQQRITSKWFSIFLVQSAARHPNPEPIYYLAQERC